MLMTKQKEPPLPDQAPAVVEARRELAKAIADQEKARGRRDDLRRILADANALPADKIRARLDLPDAEAAAEIAELNAGARQADETVKLHQAGEAQRPRFEAEYKKALAEFYAGLESIVPLNEKVCRIWWKAHEMGVEFPSYFWPEFLSENGMGEPLFVFRRHALRAEGWI